MANIIQEKQAGESPATRAPRKPRGAQTQSHTGGGRHRRWSHWECLQMFSTTQTGSSYLIQPLLSSCPATHQHLYFFLCHFLTQCGQNMPTVPFPSLSDTLRPSTQSSQVPWSFFVATVCSMGRKYSKSNTFTFTQSLWGVPRTLGTSALVGFWPRPSSRPHTGCTESCHPLVS